MENGNVRAYVSLLASSMSKGDRDRISFYKKLIKKSYPGLWEDATSVILNILNDGPDDDNYRGAVERLNEKYDGLGKKMADAIAKARL